MMISVMWIGPILGIGIIIGGTIGIVAINKAFKINFKK